MYTQRSVPALAALLVSRSNVFCCTSHPTTEWLPFGAFFIHTGTMAELLKRKEVPSDGETTPQ
jgi:hypothetical protein